MRCGLSLLSRGALLLPLAASLHHGALRPGAELRRASCTRLGAEQPPSHAALFAEGSALVQRGELAASRGVFERALAADPTHAPTRAVLEKLDSLGVSDEAEPPPALLERRVRIDGGASVSVLSPAAPDVYGERSSGVWSSSEALVRWLCAKEERRAALRGAHVLELGAGLGYVGGACVKLGAGRVVCTDLPQALPLLRRNLEANTAAGGHAEAIALAWGSTRPPPSLGAAPFDLVVAADVVYDAALVEPLAATLSALLLDRAGSVALLALPDHRDFGQPLLNERGTAVEPLEAPLDYSMLLEALAAPELGSLHARLVAVDSVGRSDGAEAEVAEGGEGDKGEEGTGQLELPCVDAHRAQSIHFVAVGADPLALEHFEAEWACRPGSGERSPGGVIRS